MKTSDYIVEYLASRGIRHFFGYQGTMIAHFCDSVMRNSKVTNHVCHNEQGAAFAAVGYAKASGDCSVAYATSGPGAINLISGIADAYYDSAPVIFITGQLNTNEYTQIKDLRQQGFQEADIVSMVKPITKYCTMITAPETIPEVLEKAYTIATTGRKGPVLIDLPMNMQRQQIATDRSDIIRDALKEAKRPVLLLGNGIGKSDEDRLLVREFINRMNIPVLTSMLARDILPDNHPLNFGMIGSAYGHRYANLIISKKADLIISIGCSMCPRQIGLNTKEFNPDAAIIRVDIDPSQLQRKIHDNETSIIQDAMDVIRTLLDSADSISDDRRDWIDVCQYIKRKLTEADLGRAELKENSLMKEISRKISDTAIIVSDVGQHQVWTAASFEYGEHQRFLCSGGHGAMGFSIPAAIGAHYASGRPVVAVCGDGSAQMNIQELQWIVRDQIPITIIVMNNNSLGLIRQQQDSLFEGRYVGSASSGGYDAPDFEKVAASYGIASATIPAAEIEKLDNYSIPADKPQLLQIIMDEKTYALPKTRFGEPIYDQQPYIDADLIRELEKI